MLNTLNVNLNTDLKVTRVPELGIKIKSQDINNNLFVLRFTDKGNAIVLDETYTVEILTKFEKSKSHRLTSATVYRDYARWEFDTSFITQDEKVVNYVYVRKAGSLVVSADANAFAFDVGLSEIDKDAGRVAEVYDENYQRYLDEFKGVADFTVIQQAEADRESAEGIRKSNELARVQAEGLRQSEFEANEASREQQTTIVNANGNSRLKYWFGSQASYDALVTKDPDTIYDIWEV